MIAQLRTNFAYSPLSGSPACVECIPNCFQCDDIYVCSSCSAGALIGGICINSTLTPSSGVAGSTAFSFDVSEFTSINSHINRELRVSPSTSQVSFTFLKLVYPDSSVVYVTDTSSFTVPIYKAAGDTSFAVTVQLVFTVNG